MTDKIDLTRRKILASIGGVGAAGAGAGMGTSALFSDEEEFENNSITAGTLDMKVDWEEHYSYPQLYGLGDPADGLDVTRTEPSDTSNYTAFPPGVEADSDSGPILWVHNDDVQAFQNATSIEAFPDTDTNGTADDGVQDDFNPENACTVLSDLNGGDGALSSSARTDNAATNPGDPLIQLQDVKPGDFGEVTLSFHLCDNPGYVWLNGKLLSAAENSITEPEAGGDPDNNSVTESGSGNGELLDEVQTALWYDDNCDNLTDGATGGNGSGGLVDVVFVIDSSGSMRGTDGTDERSALRNQLPTLASNLQMQGDVQFAIVDYQTGAGLNDAGSRVNNLNMTDDIAALEAALNNPVGSAPGTTISGFGEALSNAILYAAGRKVSGDGINFRSGSKRIYVGITDETDQSTSTQKTDAAAELNATSSAFLGIAQQESQVQFLVDNVSESEFAQFDVNDISSFETALESLVPFTGTVSGGEEIFFQGSLGDALNALAASSGIPLDGNGGSDFDESNDPPNASSRGCFEATPTTNCIGFSWWVPADVDNRIQSDSVSFNLGFSTVQCRNSDGSDST